MIRYGLIAAALALPQMAHAIADIEAVEYRCERNVKIDVAYVNSDGAPQVVVMAEGNVAVLRAVPTASGVRYQGPPVEDGYVWWTQDDDAMLGWYDADLAEEVTLFMSCKQIRK